MRAILILVIALMLIFTSGCDFEYGKDKTEKPYVRNWWRWVNTGVEISVMNVFSVAHRAHLPAYTLLYLYLRHRYNLPAICIPCPLYTSVVQNHTQKGGYTAYGSSPPC